MVLLLGCAVSVLAAEAQDPVARFTVQQAVELALSLNPRVLEVREQIDEFGELVREARSEALPRADLVLSVFRNRDPGLRNSPFFSRLIEGPDPVPPESLEAFKFTNYIWRFDVEQPLYSFGRIRNAREAAANELDGVREDVRAEENRLARDVVVACYGFLLAQQQLAVLDSERTARARQLQQVQDRFELEDATRLDVLRARVALANLGPEILAAENELNVARALVNDTLGQPVATPIEIDQVLTLPEPLPRVPEPSKLIEIAARHRPELLRFDVDRKVLENRAGVLRADLLPDFDANASFGINTFGVDNLSDLGFRSWAFGVSMNWTLFDGFRTPAAVNQLRSQVEQKRHEESSFRSTLALELERATGTWERALEAVRVATVTVEEAREAERVAEESLKWGAATTLDVLESTRALREAEFNEAQAVHAALVALADIKYLVGLRADAPDALLEVTGTTPAPAEGRGRP